MSRRIKPNAPRLILNGVSHAEWSLKNYLHLNNIFRDNDDMQTIIINSFFVQELKGDNISPWKDKVRTVKYNFGKFAQYANTWKRAQKVNE